MKSKIDVEANGIVLIDPTLLHGVLNWSPKEGEVRDLLAEFFSSDLGELVIEKGAVVPLLSIDDGGYELICRLDKELSEVNDLVVVKNGEFPLVVKETAYFFDLESLIFWSAKEIGINSMLEPGNYMVTINGFRAFEGSRVIRAGYEFVAKQVEEISPASGVIDAYMRVLL